jgi:hypothetical protein
MASVWRSSSSHVSKYHLVDLNDFECVTWVGFKRIDITSWLCFFWRGITNVNCSTLPSTNGSKELTVHLSYIYIIYIYVYIKDIVAGMLIQLSNKGICRNDRMPETLARPFRGSLGQGFERHWWRGVDTTPVGASPTKSVRIIIPTGNFRFCRLFKQTESSWCHGGAPYPLVI